ncbi:methyltransferase domain-containing protein [Pseudomonas kermanshahensis]|jgi:SAM-dependent methyltransferase|uniref:class I SAM-dependent methyltransferase n=1 Tax=Pseudomonas TaxID=286 RepID=UPI000411F50D|nr:MULTISPECIES: methyltransferase domain-containing protein [Pseudomonas]ATP49401.1 methyltransferase domain-containing protein [Pseudomonas putida]MCX2685033.1 methyltransferase domain-containing protein [Pseudomonas sp. DCB_AW]MDE4540256.1 methyltransferase domain-containing protein [Pseudomonas sp. ITEM 17296]USS54434.1 methyltransferase domain-containing protein [Pseudomonas kermanshahensis]UVL65296.1 methyltransferase domain-containing protein [Pseudomonas sp. B21-031]
MTDQAFAQADPDWVELISLAREWFNGPLGQLMLKEEEKLLEEELGRFFGGYLVHYGPCAEAPPSAPQVQRNVRLGAPLPGVEIVCEEQAWPLSEHAADVVVLQHGLDFSLSPHGLLREAASAVRPGGHLLIVGINPWSGWGMRHLFSHGALRKARCISASRVGDWLNLLGFALEKRRFGCYRPPLASPAWQQRLAGWERAAGNWQTSGGGVYLLVARKMVVGLRPLRLERREPMGKLLPLPLAKVNRTAANPDSEKH